MSVRHRADGLKSQDTRVHVNKGASSPIHARLARLMECAPARTRALTETGGTSQACESSPGSKHLQGPAFNSCWIVHAKRSARDLRAARIVHNEAKTPRLPTAQSDASTSGKAASPRCLNVRHYYLFDGDVTHYMFDDDVESMRPFFAQQTYSGVFQHVIHCACLSLIK